MKYVTLIVGLCLVSTILYGPEFAERSRFLVSAAREADGASNEGLSIASAQNNGTTKIEQVDSQYRIHIHGAVDGPFPFLSCW